MASRPPGPEPGRPTAARCAARRTCLGSSPFLAHHEQGSPVSAAECACEATAVELDRLQDFAVLGDAHAAPIGHVRVPDGALRVHADPVGNAVPEFRPHPAVGQAPVVLDVECGQSPRVGLSDDQRRAIRRQMHAVREGEPVGDQPRGAVRRDHGDHAGRELLARHQVEPTAVDVRLAGRVDDELIAGGRIGRRVEVSVDHQRTIGLSAQQQSIPGRDEQQASVRQPPSAHGKGRALEHNLPVALEVHCDQLAAYPSPRTRAAPRASAAARRTRCRRGAGWAQTWVV